jgi:peptidyl-prolyl cis-trans isomerase D
VALNDVVVRTLYDITADDMGITIDDDTVRQDNAGNGMFQNAQGQFDADVFHTLLRNNGLTEQAYVASLRNQIAVSQLESGVGAAPPAPDSLLDPIYAYRNEQRVAEVAVIPNGTLAKAPDPQNGDLEAYFKAHAEAYKAPEYRSADYISLYPSDLTDQIKVTEDELKQYYDTNPAKWVTPERRHVERMSFGTEDAAKAAKARIDKGESFEAVAADSPGVDASKIDIGWTTRPDLFPEIGDPVFSLGKGEVSAPIASPLGGYLLFKVLDIQAKQVKPLDEVKDEVAKQVKLEKASDAMYNLANDLDDQLAAGDTVKQAAGSLGLKVRSVTHIDRQGQPEDPSALEILPDAPEFLPTLFDTSTDFPSPVVETKDGGILALQVTDIEPERQRDLSEVKDRVLADWRADKQAELASQAAKDATKGLAADQALASAFPGDDIDVTKLDPIHRTDTPQVDGVGLDTVSALFDAKAGDVVVTPSTDGKGQVVARLLKVIAAKPADDPDAAQKMRDSLTGATVSDIGEEFRVWMRSRHSLKVDQAMINQYF